ncbi:MAG: RNA polymerase sigma factor [Muribaculaceae bacterium]
MTLNEFEHIASMLRQKLLSLSLTYFASLSEQRNEAEDVVQDVFLKMWSERERLDEIANIEAWAVTIAKNMCVSRLRWLSRHATCQIVDYEIVTESGDASQKVEVSEYGNKLRALFTALPRNTRRIMWLRTVRELPLDEIAVLTGRPKTSIKSTISMARKLMYEKLKELE